MKTRAPALVLAGLAGVWLLLFVLWQRSTVTLEPEAGSPGPAPGLPIGASGKIARAGGDPLALLDWVRGQLESRIGARGARPNEAVLTFKDEASYRRFLDAADTAGLQVLGRLDGLLSARVAADSMDALARGLMDHLEDLVDLGGNPYVFTPQPPTTETRAAQHHRPFGDGMLSFLGVSTDHRHWGRGVTIAIIDSGMAADVAFGTGRIRHLDLGLGTMPGDGHGTAVAALAAGASADATGVAPSASLLSIRVTDGEGLSDTFTLAQAIVAAVDAGAPIINISLGAYQNHPTLSRALDYAFGQGAAIVASAGNDQAGRLTWPAADPRVISAGAVDAIEQQVTFSNSGPQLQVTAPGYGVNTAGLDGQRISFSGTSASAPIVAGSLAAVMSTSPGLNANEAWQVLAQTVSDAGAPGADPNYGAGILNLGWAMARNDPTRMDTAVASHHYNAGTGHMEIIVQNRSAQGVAGLKLDVDSTAGSLTQVIPWLKPGGTTVVTIPVNQSSLHSGNPLIFRSQLTNPSGGVDQIPENNRKTSSLQLNAGPPSKE